MIILDTNVISEIIKKQPDEHVAAWLKNQDTSNLATTAITVAELLAGVKHMTEGRRRKYTDITIKMELMTLADRTFAFDTQAATNYASVLIKREHMGRPTSIQDAMIAAIAHSWGAAVATRNTKDFEGTGVELINPWEYTK
ncbi:type II toxin-antitoxin system VapC family toxin [Bifidobacterium felsineum]|uniref:Ribonuclease VapC n=1 Tax=Bifidobacterium felsineum TaxID=2045440 RepID=A0A2M9HIL7_9BIFI|nr:type II toxin-antitoxin system VapC family toxin [Bifidobacterium felsineum]MBT1164936.1 type II toxin-antitoxin system VapC family toxin [Bifidobacterium felsineum]PJM76668.1 VapC toxin family PIN domain ribonuclease [Bifidobacterium felsineum]